MMNSKPIQTLLVEDNPEDAEFLQEVLAQKSSQFKVVPVQQLSEAIACVQETDFDVVLLDLVLPDTQGLDTLRQFRSAAPHVPILVMTGIDDPAIALESMRAGAQDYLIKKQLNCDSLLRAIDYSLERSHLLAALRESEERWQKLVANVPGMIFQLRQTPTRSRTFLYASIGCWDLWQLSVTEIEENFTTILQRIHPEDRGSFLKLLEQSAATLQPWKWEGRTILATNPREPNGEPEHWIRGVARPEKQANGEIIWNGVFMDISDQKNTEIALRQSEIRLAEAQRVAHVGCWEFEVSTGKIYWSEEIFRISGLDPNQGTPSYEDYLKMVHPDDASVLQNAIAQAITAAIPYEFDQRIFRPDGSMRYIAAKGQPILNPNGQVVKLLGTSVDITEYKQVEQALRESQQQLQAILDYAPAIIYMKDLEGRYLLINRLYGTWFNQDANEVKGQTDFDLFPQEIAKKLRSNDQAIMAANSTIQFEEAVPQSDGIHTYLSSKFPLYNVEGKVYAIGGISTDITARKQAETERDRFFTISADLLCMIGLDGNFKRLNPTWETILGYPLDELLNHHYIEFVHPEDREATWAEMEKAQQGIPTLRFENRYRCADGSYKWLAWSAATFVEERLVYAAARDISDRKEDENEKNKLIASLQNSEAQNKALLNAIPDMMFRSTADGTYLDFKPAIGMETLVAPSVFLGKKTQDVLPLHLAEKIMDAQTRALSTGHLQTLEYQMDNDGEISHYEARIVAVNGNEVIAIIRDISDRKRTEAALLESHHFIQQIAEATPNTLYIFDLLEQRNVYINREISEVLGYTPEQIHQMGSAVLPTLLHPDDVSQVHQHYQQIETARDGEILQLEYRMKNADDSWTWFYSREVIFARTDTGKPKQIIGTATDITERKKAEEALRDSELREREKANQLEKILRELRSTQAQLIQTEKMSSLGQLVAGVAHEINNPVSFIYGNVIYAEDYAKSLLELVQLYQQHYSQPVAEVQKKLTALDLDFLTEDFPKLLHSMKEGANRIREIILSLRNFSRLDEAAMKEVNIHEGIDSTLLILQHRLNATAKRPAIQLIKEYESLPTVECFAGQLNQVFMNILVNAIDALEAGKVTKNLGAENSGTSGEESAVTLPTIQISTKMSKQDRIVISICDNGPGMNQSVRDRVFDPFFTTKPIGSGTGLGLSISYQIVEKHGGELRCFSQLGQGAEFVIELPIKQVIYSARNAEHS